MHKNIRRYIIDKLIKKINTEITSKIIRLINYDGEQLGIVPLTEALQIAKNLNLDLVEIQPKAKPPVIKIMNYGKFKFSINKKNTIAKKKQKDLKIKEVKFRPNTADNDYHIKIKNIKNFLQNGNKTKITVSFKGREIIHKENGTELIKKICNDLADFCKIESEAKFEGKNIITIVRPIKNNEKREYNEKDKNN